MTKIKLEDIKTKKNTSKKYKNGTVWITNGGSLKILERIDNSKKHAYYLCEFVGYEGKYVVASSSSINDGKVKNLLKPSVYNVGFIGYGDAETYINGKNSREYTTWRAMIRRCYHQKYPTYKNCVVDKRWHNFQNFAKDIRLLDNYDKWLADCGTRNNYELDKDIKIHGNKIYSKDTCMFVTRSENTISAMITGYVYLAIRKSDNYIEEFTNQREFARKYDLHQASVNNCLNGKQKSSKGWMFKTK